MSYVVYDKSYIPYLANQDINNAFLISPLKKDRVFG